MPLVVDTFKAGTIDVTQSITINGQPVGGDGWITETIEVSSAEILALGDTKTPNPLELLPAPGENKYYTWYGVVEFFPGLIPYKTSGSLSIRMDKTQFGLPSDLLTQLSIVVTPFNLFLGNEDYFVVNKNITLSYSGLSSITDGDGTLKIKITYKINEI